MPNNISTINDFSNETIEDVQNGTQPEVSSKYNENIIVTFKKPSFNSTVRNRFEYYGGIIKKEWDNQFISISGFAGVMPLEINKSYFQNEFPDAIIESDEILKAQMNYASVQSGAVNSTWYLNGLMGNTNSSVAVLDTGVNPNHNFFPNGYDPVDLNGDIVGWQNFVDSQTISDDNGHGTLISSIISGTGTDSYDSINPSLIKIEGNYSHTELFDEYSTPQNYTLKIFSFNASKAGTSVQINSSWNLEGEGIDHFWFELYQNNTLVNYSYNEIQNSYYVFNHLLTIDNLGIYDIYLKYYKLLEANPVFSFNAEVSYLPEQYIDNRNHFTGIANATKIVSYKILNQSGTGYTSDLISALSSVIQNRTKYHIVSVCLSVGTLGEDIDAVNAVIDEVIENGILVVIAAGNTGIEFSDSLNKLAENENAIVVGAINDEDRVTSYSSMGKEVENVIKPDIVAPGGSKLSGHRSIIAANDEVDKATASYGTSIATAIVSATINIIIEARWNDWNQWNNLNLTEWVKYIKAALLMTASETNLEREDDPSTPIDESDYSPASSLSPLLNGLNDIHEGYGRINLYGAIDALTKSIEVSDLINGYLISSQENPLGRHVFARQVNLIKDIQYSFNLSITDSEADFDIFLFSNKSNQFGEPILLQASRNSPGNWYNDIDSFYFTPKEDQTKSILIVKAINGASDFILNISTVENIFPPELKTPQVNYIGGPKNTTVLSFQEYLGMEPKKNYSIDQYRFYIEYFDNDTSNVPPQEVYVSIVEIGENYTLTQFNAQDYTYTDGALFVSNYIQFPTTGIFHYFFIASDGIFKTRYPNVGQLNITIEFPTDSIQFPNYHNFNDGIGNWTYTGTGWDILTQSNINDNRSRISQNSWNSMYFGMYHNYPNNYTYQPIRPTVDPYPNGSLVSPLFNLTNIEEEETQPFVKYGFRVSLNAGDRLNFQINLNWTGWITLRTYTNIEQEWFMEEFNLTQYKGYFVQFRFDTNLDEDYDSINYKGFILDYFAIFNYTNEFSPLIYFNIDDDISSTQDSKYQKYTFSLEYIDVENNYPEFVYLEMDDTNYTMYNIYGDWDSRLNINGDTGIYFSRSLLLDELSNRSFRFHASDGKYVITTQYYNENNSLFEFINPIPLQFNFYKDNKFIGYRYSNTNLSDYYVSGTPSPKENTAWFGADNTWHPITRLSQNFIYGGIGPGNGGYGPNWDSKLITHALHLGDEYKVYLDFDYEIYLQNEYLIPEDQLDKCTISISKDFGETWIILREFIYDDEDLSGSMKFDISQYSNEDVMIMFTLHSNDNNIETANGWLLTNIYVGYDDSNDFIHPEIKIFNPEPDITVSSIIMIRANISDNVDLDESRIYIFLNNNSVDRSKLLFNSNTSILEFNWDTVRYLDGTYEIRVVAYDKEGNKTESFINVIVYNMSWWRTWGLYIVIFGIVLIVGIIVYIISEKRGKAWFANLKNIRSEKTRLRDVDKDKLIKRLELMEQEEELKRPLTLYCKSCRSWFISQKFDIMCPVCEHDQIYAAYSCPNCGRWSWKDEPGENYYCKNKKCEGVRLIRKEKEEVQEILAKEGKFLRKFESKKKKFSILDE